MTFGKQCHYCGSFNVIISKAGGTEHIIDCKDCGGLKAK